VAAAGEEFGPYVVYEQLGLGGMATVHRAETQGIAGFRKPVALKRMLPSIAADAELVKSFIREARLASHLRHANVAQTYDLGKVGDVYFIAMELVNGRNLREIVKRCAAVSGPMPVPIVLNIVDQICAALDYAHNLCDETGQPLGIIHRDVSPSNVIVGEAGVVKLIDFGIAKASVDDLRTASKTLKGKFAYMAPEYIGGRIDARADLFAVGVIAHELLAHRPLFQGGGEMDTLQNVKTMPIQPPSTWRPELPHELDAIVMTALARDPSRRWQNANALREAIGVEARRLGLVAVNQQLADWVEGTFASAGRADSPQSISISTGMLEGSVTDEPVIDGQATALFEGQELDQLISATRPLEQAEARPSGRRRPQTRNVIRRTAPPPLAPVSTQPPPPLAAATPPAPPLAVPTRAPAASAARDEHSIGGVLSALEDDSFASKVDTKVAPGKRSSAHTRARARGLLYAILVLAIAAATAGVVYFVLPSFT
jgi:serine/threonine protein kinase